MALTTEERSFTTLGSRKVGTSVARGVYNNHRCHLALMSCVHELPVEHRPHSGSYPVSSFRFRSPEEHSIEKRKPQPTCRREIESSEERRNHLLPPTEVAATSLLGVIVILPFSFGARPQQLGRPPETALCW